MSEHQCGLHAHVKPSLSAQPTNLKLFLIRWKKKTLKVVKSLRTFHFQNCLLWSNTSAARHLIFWWHVKKLADMRISSSQSDTFHFQEVTRLLLLSFQEQYIYHLLQRLATWRLVAGDVFNSGELFFICQLISSIRFGLRRAYFSVILPKALLVQGPQQFSSSPSSSEGILLFHYGLAIFSSDTQAARSLQKHPSHSHLHTDVKLLLNLFVFFRTHLKNFKLMVLKRWLRWVFLLLWKIKSVMFSSVL